MMSVRRFQSKGAFAVHTPARRRPGLCANRCHEVGEACATVGQHHHGISVPQFSRRGKPPHAGKQAYRCICPLTEASPATLAKFFGAAVGRQLSQRCHRTVWSWFSHLAQALRGNVPTGTSFPKQAPVRSSEQRLGH